MEKYSDLTKSSKTKLIDRNIFGGKAYWTTWLIKQGFNVPASFFIPHDFDYNDDNIELLKLRIIEEFYPGMTDGSTFAVRSSSLQEDGDNESLAGSFSSFTRVEGISDVLNCIRDVIHDKNGNRIKSMGVIIQRYIQASLSGVAFSTHPIAEHRKLSLIEVVEGNCEMMMEGKMSGFPITIEFGSDCIKIIGDYPLPEKPIIELAELCKRIENILSVPVDIEWAIDQYSGQIFIIQCRPITNLSYDRNESFEICLSSEKIIPPELLTNDKVNIRLLSEKHSIKTRRAWLSLADCKSDYLNSSRDIFLETDFSRNVNGYSLVLICPQKIDGKIVRRFSSDSNQEIIKIHSEILELCSTEYWKAAIIIQELFNMEYMGLIKLLGESVLIEVAKGGFIQKGITNFSSYTVDSRNRITKIERVQSSIYDVVDGKIISRGHMRLISLDDCIINRIKQTFLPILNDNVTLEFGLTENDLEPFLIDIVNDSAEICSNDVVNGIVSRGIAKGKLRVISPTELDFKEPAHEIHFHEKTQPSQENENPGIVILCDRPDIRLLGLLNDDLLNISGMIFKEASILSHVCVILRERNIPAIILPVGMKIPLDQELFVMIDTITPNLEPYSRIVFLRDHIFDTIWMDVQKFIRL